VARGKWTFFKKKKGGGKIPQERENLGKKTATAKNVPGRLNQIKRR